MARFSAAVWQILVGVLAAGAAPAAAFPRDEAAWFAHMALPARPDAQGRTPVFPYVIGDNLKGYYRGETGRSRHVDGYRVGDAQLLAGVEAAINGQRFARERATEWVFPWGFHSEQGGHSLEFLLHSGQMAVSFTLRAAQQATLALQPVWAGTRGRCHVTARTLEIAPGAGQRWAMVLVAEGPARFSCAGQSVQTTRPARELSVHLYFADSLEAARQLAQARPPAQIRAQQRARRYARQAGAQLVTDDETFNRALQWAQAATDVFHVQEFGPGLWAGLPWFRDNWGRDTFIALPGTLLVQGRFAEARAILDNFLRWQKTVPESDADVGRIPNRVAAGDAIIYNTVDGTPLLFRAAQDYLAASGDAPYLDTLVPALRRYLDGVRRHALDAQGFLRHDDADTWMDARIAGREAWSPRGDRAVEIQALWFETLNIAADWFARAGAPAEAARCRAEAKQLQAAFLVQFWDGHRLADRLLQDGRADSRLRPNALMALTLPRQPLLPPAVAREVLRATVTGLMFPHGLASLSPEDPFFHPRHENPGLHHKDAAYHNGSIWQWNSGPLISALLAHRQTPLAWDHTRELSRQLLQAGTRGTLAELADVALDAKGEVTLSGTWAQSWSVAEFVRNAYQDYLGFRPDLLNGTLALQPALPDAWQQLSARLPFAADNALRLQMRRDADGTVWQISSEKPAAEALDFRWWAGEGSRASLMQLRLSLRAAPLSLRIRGDRAWLDDPSRPPLQPVPVPAPTMLFDTRLQARSAFRDQAGRFPVTREKDRLQRAILQTALPAEPQR